MIDAIRSLVWRLRSIRGPLLDDRHHSVYKGGRVTRLKNTAWAVLSRLRLSAPVPVSRNDLIGEIWGNRWTTGDKGLNQAIWQIRVALNDEARSPRYIQTIPRNGYRWLGPGEPKEKPEISAKPLRRAFYILVFLLLPASVMFPTNPGALDDVGQPDSPDRTAVAAYLDPFQRIVVDLEGGCRGVILPSEGKLFGEPAISADGGCSGIYCD